MIYDIFKGTHIVKEVYCEEKKKLGQIFKILAVVLINIAGSHLCFDFFLSADVWNYHCF